MPYCYRSGRKRALTISVFETFIIVQTYEESENIYARGNFFIETDFRKLAAYGHRSAKHGIAKRVCLHSAKVWLCYWNNILKVCFNKRMIYALQIIRTHNRSKLN